MEKELETPKGRRGAPGLLRARLPGVLGRQQLGSFCYPKAASDVHNLRTFSFSLSLSSQRGCRRGTGLLRWKLQRRSPGAIPTQASDSQTRRWSPALVGAIFAERTAADCSPRVRNPTKRKRKSARVYRLAPLGRRNPRCTPFFGGKGGGRGRGGAGEGSYLRFNCRWRLRLFQDRKSSPKIKQTDKKIAREHLT